MLFIQMLSSVAPMSSSATTPCVSCMCGCAMVRMTAETTLMKTPKCAVGYSTLPVELHDLRQRFSPPELLFEFSDVKLCM